MFLKLPIRSEQTPADGGQGQAAATTGATDPAASVLGAAADPAASFAEKYRVVGADGKFDLLGTARKVEEARSHLERRFGSGDVPPKAFADYKITAPEALKDTDFSKDAGVQAFLEKAHKAGYSQGQLDVALGSFFELAPQLTAGASLLDADGARSALREVFKTDAEFDGAMRGAYTAVQRLADKAGMQMAEVDATLGNNPAFLRLMAALAPELKEADPPPADAGQGQAGESIEKLMLSEAYQNPKHVDHASVSAKVRAFFDKKYPGVAA